MFFALVAFLKRAPRIIIHLVRNAEKGGGVLMSATLPNVNHSFIFPFPFPVPVPDPVPDFRVFHTPIGALTIPHCSHFGGSLCQEEWIVVVKFKGRV